MQQIKVVRKQLILDLDKNEAPTGWRWSIDRFVRFDDGSEKIVPDEIAAQADEVAAHIGAAVGKQAADIARDAQERDRIAAERDAAISALDGANAKLAAIAEAGAKYDERVKPLFAESVQQ